jgi:SagB-type dehydrogenase family enzyme
LALEGYFLREGIKMKKMLLIGIAVIFSIAGVYMFTNGKKAEKKEEKNVIYLPKPQFSGKISIETALLKRRSIRKYTDSPLTLKETGQLLWAAQGITNERGFRTAPSAGAVYPMNLYIIVQNAGGMEKAIYRYIPQGHKLLKIKNTSKINFSKISRQSWISKASVIFVITADYKRISEVYGGWGVKFANMEAGHIAQNIQLQGVSIAVGSCVVGAFEGIEISALLNLTQKETPVYLVAVGKI